MAETTTIQSPRSAEFISRFSHQTSEKTGLPGAEVRAAALEALETLELPTTKWEAWKYTSVKPITGVPYEKGSDVLDGYDPGPFPLGDVTAHRLVFINGIFASGLSDLSHDQEGVTVTPWNQVSGADQAAFEHHFGNLADYSSDIFLAMGLAHARTGVFVHIHKNRQAELPVHIIHISDPNAPTGSQVYNQVVVEPNGAANIFETSYSVGEEGGNSTESFRNQVTELFVKENASLEYVKIQSEGRKNASVDRTEVRQEKDSRCSVFTFTFNGDWVRNGLNFDLAGPHTESHLMGLYLVSDEMHVDNYTLVNHREPHSFSNELYKGIATDRATAAFSGKIHVFQKAQKTNAFQSNRNILLSKEATVNTKPQLEIYADDVKCSHGATTGQIDEEALFYLRARGIPLSDAKKLMVQAFAGEVSQEISNEQVRDYVDERIRTRFH